MSAPSEMRLLVAAIRKNGFKVARTGGAHMKVLTKDGQVVTDANGPLILSGSPSEHRWREMHVHRLMAANVLKSDPWKPTGKDGAAEGDENGNGRNAKGKTPQEVAADEARKRAAQERSDGLRGRTNELRARLEPIVVKLGGWSIGGSGVNADSMSQVMWHWVSSRRREEMPPPTSATAAMPGQSDLKKVIGTLRTSGATLALKWHPVVEVFLDELEGDGEDPDPAESSMNYLDLLREVKGIFPTPIRPGDPVQEEDVLVPYRRSSGGERDLLLTPLAQDAFWLMARGADNGEEQERVAEIAERISRLDISKREE